MIMGFSQVENIDFNETFSLVERIKSIQIMLVIFRIIFFKVLQMDVKTTFLNGDLSIYMHQLKAFVIKGEENMKLWLNFWNFYMVWNNILFHRITWLIYIYYPNSLKGVLLINVFQENLRKLLFYYNFVCWYLFLTFNDLMLLKETKDNLLNFFDMDLDETLSIMALEL